MAPSMAGLTAEMTVEWRADSWAGRWAVMMAAHWAAHSVDCSAALLVVKWAVLRAVPLAEQKVAY